MKLPNAERAVVTEEKVVEYLLNPAHPDNGGKAAFYTDLGFRRDDWTALAAALQRLAQAAEVNCQAQSPHGGKYVVVGRIESPEGRSALVRSVWIVDKGVDVARLVTAYPHRK
ncbi:MAG TPA: hypothetical protein VI136_25705 [Verrucomicrobiae bacterium]